MEIPSTSSSGDAGASPFSTLAWTEGSGVTSFRPGTEALKFVPGHLARYVAQENWPYMGVGPRPVVSWLMSHDSSVRFQSRKISRSHLGGLARGDDERCNLAWWG